MISLQTTLIGLTLALLAYQFVGPSSLSLLLPVKDGDAIVVTGSSSGIGKHAALRLAKEGFTVFASVRNTQDGEALLTSAEKFNIDTSKLKPILLDVTNTEQIAQAVETISSFVGDRGLYGLFNNAGITPQKGSDGTSVEHIAMDQVRRVFDVNYFGLLQVTKAFLPLIRRRRGRIINNTSVAGLFAGPFQSAYASSKFAVEALSDSLRREVDPFGVRVSILEPGYIKTPLMDVIKQVLTFKGNGVYAKMEQNAGRKFVKMALDAHSPSVTSEAVVHAMRSPNPKLRYVVGSMGWISKVFATMPAAWADAAVRADQDKEAGMISDEELNNWWQSAMEEFDL